MVVSLLTAHEDHQVIEYDYGSIEKGDGADSAALQSHHIHFNKAEAFEDDEVLYKSPRAVHEITNIPVADEHGHLAHYPGEAQHQQDVHKFIEQEKKEPFHPLLGSTIDTLKTLFSMTFLLVSMYVCTAAIITQQTVGTANMTWVGRATYVTIFWLLILWLAEMEGSQSCLVGLQPIDKALFRHTHKLAYDTSCLAHKGDNMERFIVGRQFLIVLVVFVTNLMAFPVPGVTFFGLDDHITNVLLGSGIAVTACAVMLGQVAQINAANCMLDFIDTYFGLFTTYVSLVLDATGLMHAVYLVLGKVENTIGRVNCVIGVGFASIVQRSIGVEN